MLRSAACLGVTFALLSLATAASAQSGAHDMEARALFEAGRVAFIDERFDDALGHFRRALELSRRPELLYNIAASLDRLEREAESLDAFRQYLAALPEAPNHEEVALRIRVLEAHVARDTAAADLAATDAAEVEALEANLGTEAPIDVVGLGPASDVDQPTGGGSVAEEPWFWVVIGLVVAGAAAGITAGVLLSADPGYAGYSDGDVTVMTLRGAF